MAFSTAFQSNAFQKNAFQIQVNEEVVAGGVIQPAGQFSRSRWRKITEEEARRKLEAEQRAEWKAQREAAARQLKADTEKRHKIAARDARFQAQDEQSHLDRILAAHNAARHVQGAMDGLAQLGAHTSAIDVMAERARAEREEEEEMLMLLELA